MDDVVNALNLGLLSDLTDKIFLDSVFMKCGKPFF